MKQTKWNNVKLEVKKIITSLHLTHSMGIKHEFITYKHKNKTYTGKTDDSKAMPA